MDASILPVTYDLAKSPPTYDFLGFLLRAERERISRGFDALDVSISPGPQDGSRKDALPPFTVEGRRMMLEGIVVAMARRLPSCVGVTVHSEPIGQGWGARQAMYGTKHIVRALQDGIAPLRAKRDESLGRYVTITLREADHWPMRNSNLAEWLKVADWFQDRGIPPIFVRDTAKANEPLPHLTDRLAATLLRRRASLYSGALLNLFVNNGPAWFCMALGAPTLVCKMLTEGCRSTSAPFLAAQGVTRQTAIPNTTLVWDEDRADVLIPAIEGVLG